MELGSTSPRRVLCQSLLIDGKGFCVLCLVLILIMKGWGQGQLDLALKDMEAEATVGTKVWR